MPHQNGAVSIAGGELEIGEQLVQNTRMPTHKRYISTPNELVYGVRLMCVVSVQILHHEMEECAPVVPVLRGAIR